MADPPGVELDATLQVDGHDVRVKVQGSGRNLLLLNGIAGSVDAWTPLLPHLGARRVIAFDAPGTGQSPPPAWPCSPARVARIAAGILTAVGAGPADVLGYSFGGAVGQELARTRPAQVRRLVLLASSSGLGARPPRPLAALLLASPARFMIPRLYELTLPTLVGGRLRTDTKLRRAYVQQRTTHRPTMRGYAYQLASLAAWTSRPWLGQIRQATLVVAGTDDPLVPIANAHALARRLPNGRLARLPGAGHAFPFTEPARTATLVTGFLDGPARGRGTPGVPVQPPS